MILPVAQLDPTLRAEMRSLYERHFFRAEAFDSDLADKHAVLLLRDANGQLGGFSTLTRWTDTWQGQPAEIFFSGDTIVEGRWRSTSELPRQWSRYVFSLAEQLAPRPCFWFLICSGYRTYRFLPVFFQQFYPTYAAPTPPDLQALLDRLGQSRFGPLYGDGVVRLEAGLRDPSSAGRDRDPHVAFFLAANPGHAQGHELACLTRLSRANLTRCGQRMVGP